MNTTTHFERKLATQDVATMTFISAVNREIDERDTRLANMAIIRLLMNDPDNLRRSFTIADTDQAIIHLGWSGVLEGKDVLRTALETLISDDILTAEQCSSGMPPKIRLSASSLWTIDTLWEELNARAKFKMEPHATPPSTYTAMAAGIKLVSGANVRVPPVVIQALNIMNKVAFAVDERLFTIPDLEEAMDSDEEKRAYNFVSKLRGLSEQYFLQTLDYRAR